MLGITLEKQTANKPLVPTALPLARAGTRAIGAAAAQRWRWAI
jgi:hypothetical protein